MLTIKVNGERVAENNEDHTPVDVAMWYNRRLRMWTLYPVDAAGNQLRQAQYAPRKDMAQILKKDILGEIEAGDRTGYYY